MSQAQSVPVSLPELRERAEQEEFTRLSKHVELLGNLIKARNDLRTFDDHNSVRRMSLVMTLKNARSKFDEFEAGRAQ